MRSHDESEIHRGEAGGVEPSLTILCGSPSIVQPENVTMASVSDLHQPLRSTTCTPATRHVRTVRESDCGPFLIIVYGNCTFRISRHGHQFSSRDTGAAFTAGREFLPCYTSCRMFCVPKGVNGCHRASQVSELTLADRQYAVVAKPQQNAQREPSRLQPRLFPIQARSRAEFFQCSLKVASVARLFPGRTLNPFPRRVIRYPRCGGATHHQEIRTLPYKTFAQGQTLGQTLVSRLGRKRGNQWRLVSALMH
ncbi:uncharacterized protein CC84DRAFT_1169410 [Paraphaeosphaeria sporulosa]|uniref:Uncharacterized protein n=1 Tax=Paraphaeosphaeria sporulosa TaxID=1460663 RepID=A0A177BX53_9PLEO|nr:uncharacterized protein CC84DRAFT_1169410 [Paraphaeosphaeria sporulosa]OAF99271.1 hypothetical protein CC84DRAFT_1169410 [Paraphaeosphaeria sporulosa]